MIKSDLNLQSVNFVLETDPKKREQWINGFRQAGFEVADETSNPRADIVTYPTMLSRLNVLASRQVQFEEVGRRLANQFGGSFYRAQIGHCWYN